MTEVVYRLYETVDELTTVIENARSVPMSSSCMVPRDHLLDLLDELRESLPVRRAVCPGSFDPVTNGHVDVITRAAALYDELVVAVLVNPGKAGLFSVAERMELLRESVADLPTVTVDSFEGLLVDYCRSHDIPVIVKGLRAVSDFEYELQMAQMNRELAAVETLFVPTAPQVGHLSSSLVKQIATFGGDVSRLVPKVVNDRLIERTRKTS